MENQAATSAASRDIHGGEASTAKPEQPPGTTTGATASRLPPAGPSTDTNTEERKAKRMHWEGADAGALYTLLLCGGSRKITSDDKKKLSAKLGCTQKTVTEKQVKMRDTQCRWMHEDEIWRRDSCQKPVHSRTERKKMAEEAKARDLGESRTQGAESARPQAAARKESGAESMSVDVSDPETSTASDGLTGMATDGAMEK